MTAAHWRMKSHAERDAAYNSSAAVTDGAAHVARWTAGSAARSAPHREHLDIPYAPKDRPKWDPIRVLIPTHRVSFISTSAIDSATATRSSRVWAKHIHPPLSPQIHEKLLISRSHNVRGLFGMRIMRSAAFMA
jgi:hypothetical protein